MAYPINEVAAFNTSKEAILNLMRSRHCADVSYVDEKANSYNDLVPIIFEFAKTFDCDTDYLVTILNLIPADVLLAQKIYLNQTLATVDNPKLIVGGAIDQVNLIGPGYFAGLEIHNNANISKISLKTEVQVKNITIASGSVVDEMEIDTGCQVEFLHIKCCNEDRCGKLLKLFANNQVSNLAYDQFATFGGEFCKPQSSISL